MGAKLLQLEREGTLTIALDSQAAIQTTGREAMVSGQYLVNALHRQMEGLSPGRVGKTLRWVLGHKGVLGNEKADEEVKAAAEGFVKTEFLGRSTVLISLVQR